MLVFGTQQCETEARALTNPGANTQGHSKMKKYSTKCWIQSGIVKKNNIETI